MRILVAEDDPASLRLLHACLVEWGYKVTSVTDGQKALEVLQGRKAPRLAILNWIMPRMNGIDVCREIRKKPRKPYTYILVLTAKAKEQDVVEGLQSGADDYLTEPYNPHELRARLRAGRRILSYCFCGSIDTRRSIGPDAKRSRRFSSAPAISSPARGLILHPEFGSLRGSALL
jgi:DNA-binding response OmpR family regulator